MAKTKIKNESASSLKNTQSAKLLKKKGSDYYEPTDNRILNNILRLGGTEDDLDLLKGIDDDPKPSKKKSLSTIAEKRASATKDTQPTTNQSSFTEKKKEKPRKLRKGKDGAYSIKSSTTTNPANWRPERPRAEETLVPSVYEVPQPKTSPKPNSSVDEAPKEDLPLAKIQKTAGQGAVSGAVVGLKVDYPIKTMKVARFVPPVVDPGMSFVVNHINGPAREHAFVLVKGDKWAEQQDEPAPIYDGKLHVRFCDIENYARKLLSGDSQVSVEKLSSREKSDMEWMKQVITTGTRTDRLFGLISLMKTDPIHNLHYLELALTQMSKRAGRNAVSAVEPLQEIFLHLLPMERRLRDFRQMPLHTLEDLSSGNKLTVDKHLIIWYFESQLKKAYGRFIETLLRTSFYTIKTHQLSVIKTAYKMLAARPEGEQLLLAGICDKLGAPDKHIATAAMYRLLLLVKEHPRMKTVVSIYVEKVLYRPNIAASAQYYSIVLLNQFELGENDGQLASKLLIIYLSFFKAAISKGEVDSKLMTAILRGIQLVIPLSVGNLTEQISEQINNIHKVVHSIHFPTSLQALMILYKLASRGESSRDRFYNALYAKMLDPEVKLTSKKKKFLTLLYISIRDDPSNARAKAFVKRLLQICARLPAPYVCAALLIIGRLRKFKVKSLTFKSKKKIRFDGDNEDDVERFVDITDPDDEETEIIVKTEPKEEPVEDYYTSPADKKPFDKEGAALDQLVSELNGTTAAFAKPEIKCLDEKKPDLAELAVMNFQERPIKSSWVFTDKSKCGDYNPLEFEVLKSNADGAIEFELTTLVRHYHPSVSLFAQNLLRGRPINYRGEPLIDFGLQRFLDRFAYRNPKKLEQQRQKRIAAKGLVGTAVRVIEPRYKWNPDEVAINSAEFYRRNISQIPADQLFFHKFFHKLSDMGKLTPADKALKGHEKTGDGEVSDDEFDRYMDRYESLNKDTSNYDLDADFAAEFKKDLKNMNMSDEEIDDDDDFGDFDDLKPEDFGIDADELKKLPNVLQMKDMKSKMEEELDELNDDDSDGELPLTMDGEDDIDEEDIEFSDGDDNGLKGLNSASGRKYVDKDIAMKAGRTRQKMDGSDDFFNAADEVGELMEESNQKGVDTITANATINTTKAGTRQLAWESKQETRLSGQNWKKRSSSFTFDGPPSKRRGGFNERGRGRGAGRGGGRGNFPRGRGRVRGSR